MSTERENREFMKAGKSLLKRIWAAMAAAAVFIVLFILVERLVVPKYEHGIVEGALISQYYDDEPGHDVIFIGDCEVYENFSPVVLWNEYGINSYIRGSAEQLVWQSYYIAEDTLRYEIPKTIVFNVLAMEFNTPQNEAYNRMTLEGMKWSVSKAAAIRASMTEDEHFIEYVFPILRYHSRIFELSADDVRYLFRHEKVSHNGYCMRVGVKPVTTLPRPRILADYSFGDNAYAYLDRLRVLCEDNGINLLLIKAPSVYPYWYPEWEKQICEYADKHGLSYINFLDITEACGIDYSTDTYDAGLHMNLSGAEKLSVYLGDYLISNGMASDRRDDASLQEAWRIKTERYNEERDRLLSQQENN